MSKKGKKNLWNPAQIEVENDKDIEQAIRNIKHYTHKLHTEWRSVTADFFYDELLKNVEALYGLLRLDLLAQDNRRRSERDAQRGNRDA